MILFYFYIFCTPPFLKKKELEKGLFPPTLAEVSIWKAKMYLHFMLNHIEVKVISLIYAWLFSFI